MLIFQRSFKKHKSRKHFCRMLQLHFTLNMTRSFSILLKWSKWNGKCFDLKSSVSFKKCLILNKSFKWSVIKTTAANEKILFNSVGSQTGRDNMLALPNSAHLVVFPFLDWKLDFLLHCLYRITQTIQEDHVGATVFRRNSCIWIKDTTQLHVWAFSSS